MTLEQDETIRRSIKRLERILREDVNMVFQGIEPGLKNQVHKKELRSIIVSLQLVEKAF